ncbi:hypothetical protein LMG28614_06767 [Paraburkholderia ultramafica]|uniref:TIR domain-containing protein n=1 Tax=Paraburkholderia ultramafica TaxID=1544867 RepID=A0A6S7BQS3_9BURK|nr:TIR domain-containing protein [Paraburkholderia ultramafica]CAB3808299.1 hypothetical protein LMG28614_06767 [Paraburkholderia ultramafica]
MKVFLSYAKEDGAIVKEFHDHLKAMGLDPWMDQERLLPGQPWEREIDRALKEANVVILFMSPRSVKKRSFVTREANTAIANLRYKKADDIYVIPVLIEQCEVPEEISERAQYIEISEPGAKNKIVASIMRAAEQQEIAILNGVEHGPYHVYSRSHEEKKPGQPGYDISLDYPEFVSAQFPEVAQALTKFFQGRAAKILLDNRSKPWDQNPDFHPEPEDEFNPFHSNGRWENFGVVSATEHVVSVYFNCSWYGAGAAHSNEYHEGFNFAIIDGQPYPFNLRELFTNAEKAAEIISQECRKSLAREYWNRSGMEIDSDEYWKETFLTNTAASLSNFDTFTVADGKLTFYFAPYRVAAYSFGSFTVDVPLYDLREVLARCDKSPLVY